MFDGSFSRRTAGTWGGWLRGTILLGLGLGLGLLGVSAEAQVVFHELMVHAASQDPREDFIELRNLGTAAVDLAGWRIAGGIGFEAGPGTVLGPGALALVVADRERFSALHPGVGGVIGTFTGQLSNAGETLRLEDARGATVDEVGYADDGDWAVRIRGPVDFGHRGWVWEAAHDGGGASLELVQPALERNTGQNWLPSLTPGGTPGAPNGVASTNVAPLILDVAHSPVLPGPEDPVVVRARLADEAGPATVAVQLRFRVDGEPGFAEVPMRDDGSPGDGLPGDGVFAGILPARPSGTVVEFYVEARDATGLRRTWPAAALDDGVPVQAVNALYQVEEPAPAGALPEYRLVLTAADLAELTQINRNRPSAPFPATDQTRSHAPFGATFISREGSRTEVRYRVGVRNRGNGSRSRSPQSFRVDFGADARWEGVRALNLNTQYPDSQRLGSAVFRQAGLAAAEVRPVQLRVNGLLHATTNAPSYGTVAAVEVLDGDFLERQFPLDPGGNLYRAQRVDGVSHAALDDRGPGPDPYRPNYEKRTNEAEDDWSDLIELCRRANAPTGALYAVELQGVVDADQWVRYFALNAIANNRETSPVNGDGDDYFLYRGTVDPRFRMLPYDLDTLFGAGDSTPHPTEDLFLLVGQDVPAFERFLTDPEFAPRYYAEVRRQCLGAFDPARFDPFVEHVLGGVTPKARRDAIRAFNAQRVAFLRSSIPAGLSATSSVASVSQAVLDAGIVRGRSDPVRTRSVRVNGEPASWVAWQARWSAPAVPLAPGINRIEITAHDGAGVEIDRTWVEVTRTGGPGPVAVGGTVSGTSRWTAAEGPYRVTSTVSVPAGARLEIEAGTTVEFAAGTGLEVQGELQAAGTRSARIRLRPEPGVSNPTNAWAGIVFSGASKATNRLVHVDFEGAGADGATLDLSDSVVEVDGCTFAATTRTYIETHQSSLRVSRSVFPSLSARELIHGADIRPGGFLVVEGNWFGTTTGLNDIIDFSRARRPGPVLEVRGNVFTGASDDVLDLDGCDAHVEGNLFLNVSNGDPAAADTSSAVSYGEDGGYGPHVVVVRNWFLDVDHVALCKEGGWLTLEHNTAHRVRIAAVNFSEPLRGTTPGAGARLAGNLFSDCPATFENRNPANGTVRVETIGNLLPAGDLPGAGPGNLSAPDPLLVNPAVSAADSGLVAAALALLEGSPARGAGPWGDDLGAGVPAGAALGGLPRGTTWRREFTVTLGGPGITEVRWRLDGGAWSDPLPAGSSVAWSGLAPGPHRAEAVGRDSSGRWQEEAAAAVRTFTIDPAVAGVRLNEVLAANRTSVFGDGLTPDWIELFNDGPVEADLSGTTLSDDPSKPRKFVFPAGTRLAPGAYLVVAADAGPIPGLLSTGFRLGAEGDQVRWLGPAGELRDAVVFGPQVEDGSLARDGNGAWDLGVPTPGGANRRAAWAPPSRVRINEWLARARYEPAGEFVELFQDGLVPARLDGVALTDNPVGFPRRAPFPALSFLGPGSRMLLAADGRASPGHLDFRFDASAGSLAVVAPDGSLIDGVMYGGQTADVSEGRSPDGADRFRTFSQPTPGAPNPGLREEIRIELARMPLIVMTNRWRYDENGRDPGIGWREPGFDDAAWPEGGALFHHETAELPAPKVTPVVLGPRTHYFRTRFAFAGDTNGAALELSHIVDDGAVFWLNGRELARYRMPTGEVAYGTSAASTVSDAVRVGPETLPADALVPGENVLAVEVHQSGGTSTDVVFGAALDVVRRLTNVVVSGSPVVLNEVRARSPEGESDWVELHVEGGAATDLGGLSLTDDVAEPRKFVFPAGTTMPPGGFFLVRSGVTAPGPAPVPALPFDLSAEGGGVFLFDRPDNGGGLIDAIRYGHQLEGYTSARVPDGTGRWTLASGTPGEANRAAAVDVASGVRINEWMADPSSGEDWFEVCNPGALPVDLGGFSFSDDEADPGRSRIPALTFLGVGPAGFAAWQADGDATRPGHAAFRLSRSGEVLGLFDPAGAGVDVVRFGAQVADVSEGRFPDAGSGVTAFPGTASRGLSNYLPLPGLVVSELLAHTDPPLEDAVEFQNLAAAEWNLEGWYLSDDGRELRKRRISEALRIAPGGWGVVYEATFNPAPGSGAGTGFTLNSARGGTLWLSEADATGRLTGRRLRQDFGPTANGVSLGRVVTSTGSEDLAPLTDRTFGVDRPGSVEAFRFGRGGSNAPPLVGPVVVSEIHFQPPHPVAAPPTSTSTAPGADDAGDEFVEVWNAGAAPARLQDPLHPENRWRLSGAVAFEFPVGFTLPARRGAVVVGFDPEADPARAASFRAGFGVPADVPLLGPFQGRLADEGDRLVLDRPDAPQLPPHPDAGLVPRLLVEAVEYAPDAPWPAGAAGTGASLHRASDPVGYGNEPRHWRVAVASPGRWDGGAVPGDADGDGLPDEWESAFGLRTDSATDVDGADGDPDRDGVGNADEWLGGTSPRDATSVLRLRVRLVPGNGGDPGVELGFRLPGGRRARLEERDDPAAGPWREARVWEPAGDDREVWAPATPTTAAARWYRLRIEAGGAGAGAAVTATAGGSRP